VKFHDGSEVVAEDVVFSMKRLMTIGKGLSGTLGTVTSSEVIDQYTVEFTLGEPSSVFPNTLANFWILNKDLVLQHVVPTGEFGEYGDYGQDWLAVNDAGSGPYVMTSHEINDRLTAVRFEDYFLGWEALDSDPAAVPIDNLIFLMFIQPATGNAMLRSRQLDIDVSTWPGVEQVENFANMGGIRTCSFPYALVTIFLNTTKPPTDDVHFRRAMIYAFDYEGIAPVFPGAIPGAPILSDMLALDSSTVVGMQDLDRAKEELALSKYDPRDYVVTINSPTGVDIADRVLLQLQVNLAQIGITAEVGAIPWASLAANVANPESTPSGTLMTFIPTYPSADFFLYYMYHPDVVGGVYASHWMVNEDVGSLIDQSRLTVDPTEQLALYREIQQRIFGLSLAIYALEAPVPHPVQEYLVGPEEIYPMIGPNLDMHHYRIDLERKQEVQ